MYPKYKSNSIARSEHIYLSFIFSQEFPAKKMFHQNEGINLNNNKKKGGHGSNK